MTKSWDPLQGRLAQVYQGEDLIDSGAQQPGVSTPPPPGLTSVSPQPGVTSVPSQPGVTSVSPSPGVASVSSQPGVTSVSPSPGVANVSSQPGVTSVSPSPGVTSVSPQPGITSASPQLDVRSVQNLQAVPAASEHSEMSAPPRSVTSRPGLSHNEAARQNPPATPERPSDTKAPDSRSVAASPPAAHDPLQDRITQLHQVADLIDSAAQHPLSAGKVLALGITHALAPDLLPSPPESLRERATADSAAGQTIRDQFVNLMAAGQQHLPAHWTVWPNASATPVVQALTHHAADPTGSTPGGARSLSDWADGMQAAQILDRRGHDQLLEAQRLIKAASAVVPGSTTNALLALAAALPKAQQGCNDRTKAAHTLSAHIDEAVTAFQNHTQNTEYLSQVLARVTNPPNITRPF